MDQPEDHAPHKKQHVPGMLIAVIDRSERTALIRFEPSASNSSV